MDIMRTAGCRWTSHLQEWLLGMGTGSRAGGEKNVGAKKGFCIAEGKSSLKFARKSFTFSCRRKGKTEWESSGSAKAFFPGAHLCTYLYGCAFKALEPIVKGAFVK